MKKIIFILITLAFISGCEGNSSVKVIGKSIIPYDATIKEIVPSNRGGSYGWIIFEWRNQCFAMYQGYKISQVTKIDCE